MSGKILVTGATGKVGSEVVKQLAAKGQAVRAGVHHPDKSKELEQDKVEVVHFDYSDSASIEAALTGVEGLFVISPPFAPDSNEIVQNLVDLAKKAGVKHIVKLSAAGVEYDETSPLRIAEKKIEASGIPYTHLRPTFFSQNFSTSMLETIKQGDIQLPTGEGKAGFIDTRDIAAVAVAALTEPEKHTNRAYTLTGPEALNYYEVAAFLSKAIGKEVTYTPISDEEFRATAAAQYWPQPLVEALSGLYAMLRGGSANYVTSSVNDVLGRDPISVEQFANDHAEVWK